MKTITTFYNSLTLGGKITMWVWGIGSLALFIADLSVWTVILSLIGLFFFFSFAVALRRLHADEMEKKLRMSLSLDPFKQVLYENLLSGRLLSLEELDQWGQRQEKEQRLLAAIAFEEALLHVKTHPEELLILDQSIESYLDALALPSKAIYSLPQYEDFLKLLVFRYMKMGRLPSRMDSKRGSGALNLQRNEEVLWSFPNVEYSEERIEREYHSGHRGQSVRIAKGLTLHSGSSRGKVISKTVKKPLATGTVVVTTKSFYFQSATKAIRIPHEKVISYAPQGDSLVVNKDGTSPKPIYFRGLDSYFLRHLIQHVPGYLARKECPLALSPETEQDD